MIPFDEAQRLVSRTVRALSPIRSEVHGCSGLILSEDVIAPDDSPRFDNSAMDGYAVLSSSTASATPDEPVRLSVAGSAEIGKPRVQLEHPDHAIRIMTGSPLPAGVDAVIKQEDVEVDGEFIIVRHAVPAGLEVRAGGEEVRAGGVALRAGTMLTPPATAFLSGLGVNEVCAYPRPRVSILITGNEIVPPAVPGDSIVADAVPADDSTDMWKVRDSNSVFLSHALKDAGVYDVRVLFADDSKREITEALTHATQECDLLLVSGGVSVGPRDHVKEVFADLGVTQVFWRVSQKPGKPLYFGTIEEDTPAYVFGLPGNVASVAFCYYEYVMPALGKMMARSGLTMPRSKATLKCAVENDTGRTYFMKGRLERDSEGLLATPVGHQGSHVLESLTRSDCFVVIPIDTEHAEKGTEVEVHILPWSNFI